MTEEFAPGRLKGLGQGVFFIGGEKILPSTHRQPVIIAERNVVLGAGWTVGAEQAATEINGHFSILNPAGVKGAQRFTGPAALGTLPFEAGQPPKAWRQLWFLQWKLPGAKALTNSLSDYLKHGVCLLSSLVVRSVED
jgi:hypothetical protein